MIYIYIYRLTERRGRRIIIILHRGRVSGRLLNGQMVEGLLQHFHLKLNRESDDNITILQ